MRSGVCGWVTAFAFSFALFAQAKATVTCHQELGDQSPALARILAMPDGNALAHTTRSIQVAKELRKRGYEVLFATDGKYVPLIEQAGFSCEPHLTLDPKNVMEICRYGRTNYYSEAFLTRCIEEDCKLFERVAPDLVLSDFRFSVSTSAEIAKIPHAVVLNALWTNYFSGRLTAPEGTFFGKFLPRVLIEVLSPFFTKIVKGWILKHDNRVSNRVRKSYGLSPKTNLLDWIAGGDLNLIADIPSFGPTENLPKGFLYVGPIVWQPELPLPDWLGSLKPEQPKIYVSMGSSGDPKMFDEVVRVFGNTDYQCMVTTAGLTKLEGAPSNIHVVDFAPGEKLIAEADLVICQGGNGTVYQALRQGVPVLGYPTMHDQHFNMDQVERLGMGKRMSLHPFRPEDLRKEAVTLIENAEAYRERAKAIQEEFVQYPGESAAAEAIDQFLSRRSLKGQ